MKIKTWFDMITKTPDVEHNVWEHVTPVLNASREIVQAYRVLPVVDAATPRPVAVVDPQRKILWEVPVPGSRTVFMSAERTNFLNDERFVVFVLMNEFYAIWRAIEAVKDPDGPGRPPELSKIPQDRKYGYQDARWAEGVFNPVPLADVSYHESNGIGFSDGITRTLWLIHNRVPVFPVMVHGRNAAQGLHDLVGDNTIPIQNISSLLGLAQ